jgi:RND family efflux transporter MFP subunit
MLTKNKFLTVGIVLVIIATVIILIRHFKSKEDIIPSASVQVSIAQYMPMSKSLTVYGTVSFPLEQTQQISVQNEVRVLQIFVTQGQRVNKNDPLLQLTPSGNAKLTFENAKTSVEFAKKELDRLLKLRVQFLATNADIQVATQNLTKAEAELRNLQTQQQNENGNILRSNSDGIVLAVNVQTGQIVPPNTALLSFASDDKRQIRLGIENEDLAEVHLGQQVIITPLQNEKLEFIGYIKNITGQIDPNTGLIDVIVLLDKAPELISGSMVRGRIIIKHTSNTIAIPRSAVLYLQDKPYIFVAVNGKAQQRWITVGDDNGQFVSILSGLKVNEKVVVVGNYELTDGMVLRMELP